MAITACGAKWSAVFTLSEILDSYFMLLFAFTPPPEESFYSATFSWQATNYSERADQQMNHLHVFKWRWDLMNPGRGRASFTWQSTKW